MVFDGGFDARERLFDVAQCQMWDPIGRREVTSPDRCRQERTSLTTNATIVKTSRMSGLNAVEAARRLRLSPDLMRLFHNAEYRRRSPSHSRNTEPDVDSRIADRVGDRKVAILVDGAGRAAAKVDTRGLARNERKVTVFRDEGDSVPRPLGFYRFPLPVDRLFAGAQLVAGPSLVLAPKSALRLLPSRALSSASAVCSAPRQLVFRNV
jgi:hypothetical protein